MELKEIASAFTNPSWWVLTVIVGLLLNVLAPFINKWIESIWAARSTKRAKQVEQDKQYVADRADHLKSKPTGALEAKADCIYWITRIILLLCIYLMLIQVAFAAIIPLLSFAAIPIAIIAFFHITVYYRSWKEAARIHNIVIGAEEI
jgi:uncharacterized metal-binding protein